MYIKPRHAKEDPTPVLEKEIVKAPRCYLFSNLPSNFCQTYTSGVECIDMSICQLVIFEMDTSFKLLIFSHQLAPVLRQLRCQQIFFSNKLIFVNSFFTIHVLRMSISQRAPIDRCAYYVCRSVQCSRDTQIFHKVLLPHTNTRNIRQDSC